MSIDVDVLIEMYDIMKQYIPPKDRQEVADNLMSVMVDMLGDDDIRSFGSNDSALKRAFKEYAEEEDEGYDENE